MEFWNILYIIDWVLFVFAVLTVLYMLFFTITSMLSHKGALPKTNHQNRFIILIPAYKNKRVLQTVRSMLAQTYPQRQFDISVVSDHNDEMTNMRLAQEPITLLTPNFEKSTKAKYLQLAINNLPQFKIYDIIVVLDAGDLVEPEFLENLNAAFESAGTKAIQTHILSRNRDTTAARMGAIFEEINNSIFRRGHIAVGLSAGLMGSGCAFDFNWFKGNIFKVKSAWEDKELDAMLMRQHVHVDYFDQIYVYNEKTRESNEFNRERGRWLKAQYLTLLKNIQYLPVALVNRHYSWADKIIQWMLMPRMVLMAVIILMSIIMPMIYTTLAFKWWGLFTITLLVCAMATPDYLVDKNWNATFFKSPLVFMKSIPGLSRIADWIEIREQKGKKKD
ncbi:glycosyltransferase family 2 protein [Prevotella sp. tf2-5]|uniref:glycosyltransferase family 2 protein n=1 Tax=Prevotella sp. tf2-5 TaxID=1761889 RepID=UPI0008E1E1D9|nr:glycosyltransferase family 2 protein [Prevotella sp. tf2-5]SFO53372.1 Glycosyltransferase, catalytic subunit of cellulose synthase and poly-beta-1,6-N-acetylglucosamine synthase [Prevotella sp. tf2-5]